MHIASGSMKIKRIDLQTIRKISINTTNRHKQSDTFVELERLNIHLVLFELDYFALPVGKVWFGLFWFG